VPLTTTLRPTRNSGATQSGKKAKKGEKSALKASIAPPPPSAQQPSGPIPPIDIPDLGQLIAPLTQPNDGAPQPAAPGSEGDQQHQQQQQQQDQPKAGTDQVSLKEANMFLDFLLGSGA
jgi:hypothetical protein